MAGVYSRNKYCDSTNWIGEASLDILERFVFADLVTHFTPIESFEESLDIFWPRFVEDGLII